MSTEQVMAFWKVVQGDPRLQGEIGSASDGDQLPEVSKLCTIAANAGFECAPKEFEAVEDVVRFWDWANEGDRLRERLESAHGMSSHDETLREIVRIGGEAGFIFTIEQLDSVTRVLFEAGQVDGQQLTDEEADQVAGGAGQFPGRYKSSFVGALKGGWSRKAGGRPFGAISF